MTASIRIEPVPDNRMTRERFWSVPYSETILEMVRTVFEGGTEKDVPLHSLRHTFATHLSGNAVDWCYIQEILGHKSSRTTEIYAHVCNRNLRMIKNPLDDMLQGGAP